jgi:DnaJ family protein A protein 2
LIIDAKQSAAKKLQRCKKCKGEKVVQEKTRQEIHVERGMTDGQRIVLAGAGDQEVGTFPTTTLAPIHPRNVAWPSSW